jgi:hypothetical protein
VTVAAVGFLLLDGILLGAAGFWDGRPVLAGWGGACVLLAGVVLVLRRRYVRQWREIATARAHLRQELRTVQPHDGPSRDA